jgi:hypothetical protein
LEKSTAAKGAAAAFAALPIALNSHTSGVSPAAFAGSPPLVAAFDVLATGRDRAGKTFIASIEGKDLPIYAMQFHPEKSQDNGLRLLQNWVNWNN